MKLLANTTGEQFLEILEETGDALVVQFITNEGLRKGKAFRDSLSGLILAGWTPRSTSTAIGLRSFSEGKLQDPEVSYALHQQYPLGRKVRLPSGKVVTIASYANTHADGYYIYVRYDGELKRLKISPDWQVLPSEQLLALPYYPAPKTQQEIDTINDFDSWAGGY